MTSFTANPSAITDGDAFTLSWTAPCGFVSLAQTGQSPFIVLQPSTGSYALRPGLNGYPTVSGDTIYEAKNGDTATPLRTTVTMNPKRAPTISLSGASSCYPVHAGNAGCNVQVTANASNYDSISWGGCCSGSGTTANCHVSGLGSFTCTANATGSGGSAQASAQVTGINAAPTLPLSGIHRSPDTADCNTAVTFDFTITDEEGISWCPSVTPSGACVSVDSAECPVSGSPKVVRIRTRTWPTPQTTFGHCYIDFKAQDVWGAEVAGSWNAGVNACP